MAGGKGPPSPASISLPTLLSAFPPPNFHRTKQQRNLNAQDKHTESLMIYVRERLIYQYLAFFLVVQSCKFSLIKKQKKSWITLTVAYLSRSFFTIFEAAIHPAGLNHYTRYSFVKKLYINFLAICPTSTQEHCSLAAKVETKVVRKTEYKETLSAGKRICPNSSQSLTFPNYRI